MVKSRYKLSMGDAIRKVVSSYGISAHEVNAGRCEDLAMEVIGYEYNESSPFPGAEEACTENYPDLNGAPGHVWIKYQSKHHDSEAPDGVNSPSKLPIFQRWFSRRKE